MAYLNETGEIERRRRDAFLHQVRQLALGRLGAATRSRAATRRARRRRPLRSGRSRSSVTGPFLGRICAGVEKLGRYGQDDRAPERALGGGTVRVRARVDRTISDVPLKPSTSRRTSRLDLAARPASIRIRAASIATATATGSGRCASSPASAPPSRPTSAITSCSSKGQHGLSVAFDMPTLMGYDSDAPQARGEVGKCGVAIDSLADMEVLFDGIDMGDITTSMTINGPACIALAQYIAAAENKGIPRAQARRHDSGRHSQRIHRAEGVDLPAAAAHAHHRRHDRVLHARDAEVEHDLDLRLPHPRSRLDGRAGAGLYAGRRLRLRRGLHGRRHGRRLVCAAPVVLLQLAHRLLRRDRQVPGGAAHLRAPHAREVRRARIRARGSCASTRRPPAAAPPRSSPRTTSCASPTRRWRRCSAERSRCTPTRWTKCWRCRPKSRSRSRLRTQQVLAYETNVTNVVDPLGGSYFVEALTDEMERQAEAYFAQIAEYGGVIEAIEAGFFQHEIAEASLSLPALDRNQGPHHRRRQRVRARRREAAEIDLLKITEETERAQARSVQAVRANARRRRRRDPRWSACKRRAAIRTINLMPHLIDCVNALLHRRRDRRSDGGGLRPLHGDGGTLKADEPSQAQPALPDRDRALSDAPHAFRG